MAGLSLLILINSNGETHFFLLVFLLVLFSAAAQKTIVFIGETVFNVVPPIGIESGFCPVFADFE